MYKDVAKNIENFTLQIPKTVIPIPTEFDYDNGFLRRYFIQKTNDSNGFVFEVSEEVHDELRDNPFWKVTDLKWRITGPDLYKMNKLVNTEFYGELNLSQANIDELTKIYIEKIGEDLMKLLQTTKDFTENIGKYFSSADRTEALAANQTAINQGGQIITTLASDPAGTTETE